MKVSVATDNGMVAGHFGRCPEYTIANIVNGKVENIQTVKNPGHEPGRIPQFLHEQGVESIICGGIGARAIGFFADFGIEVVAGIQGNVAQVLNEYAKGNVKGKESLCKPGGGKGYGLDKAACDHAHDEEPGHTHQC